MRLEIATLKYASNVSINWHYQRHHDDKCHDFVVNKLLSLSYFVSLHLAKGCTRYRKNNLYLKFEILIVEPDGFFTLKEVVVDCLSPCRYNNVGTCNVENRTWRNNYQETVHSCKKTELFFFDFDSHCEFRVVLKLSGESRILKLESKRPNRRLRRPKLRKIHRRL